MGCVSLLQGMDIIEFSIHIINNTFKAFKFQGDYGSELSLGTYTSGEGIFDSDPMMFEGGDSINCGNGEGRSTIAFWYCWYKAFPDPPVPLDTM